MEPAGKERVERWASLCGRVSQALELVFWTCVGRGRNGTRATGGCQVSHCVFILLIGLKCQLGSKGSSFSASAQKTPFLSWNTLTKSASCQPGGQCQDCPINNDLQKNKSFSFAVFFNNYCLWLSSDCCLQAYGTHQIQHQHAVWQILLESNFLILCCFSLKDHWFYTNPRVLLLSEHFWPKRKYLDTQILIEVRTHYDALCRFGR